MASLQVAEGVKILLGKAPGTHRFVSLDLWSGEFRAVQVERDPRCPCCAEGRFPFLEG